MGTSTNQASPRSGPASTNWAAVAAGYASPDVSLERVLREVWRAAQAQAENNWRALLKSPGVLYCLDASALAGTPEEAVSTATRRIVRFRQSSLAADVAKRALVQGFLAYDDPRKGFAQALFSEVTDYLVSRDLPGFIGERYRNRRINQAIEFKANIRARVQQDMANIIEDVGLPDTGDQAGWDEFVDTAVTSLSG